MRLLLECSGAGYRFRYSADLTDANIDRIAHTGAMVHHFSEPVLY
ncbi:MAG TPA: hypothetical protein VFS21_03925 [Roseiflexaceae bacterium]|nr:hypothetical protein [Roseiflexaceae bacterium]